MSEAGSGQGRVRWAEQAGWALACATRTEKSIMSGESEQQLVAVGGGRWAAGGRRSAMDGGGQAAASRQIEADGHRMKVDGQMGRWADGLMG